MLFFRKVLILNLLLLLIGCRKASNANWDVDASLPIVNSVLNIQDYLGDTLFSTDQNGVLHFVYNREVAALKLDTILKLPDTSVVRTFTSDVPVKIPLQPGEPLSVFEPSEITFDISNGVAIKKAIIREGLMTVKFSNFIKQPMDLICVITSASKDGQKFKISETIPTGTNTLIKSYDLAGYSLDMRGLTGTKYNTIVQTYTLGLNPNASSVTVAYGDGAKIEITYSEIVPEYIEGYFGQQEIDLAVDTAQFGLGKNFKADQFMLSDVTMNFDIVNEFGAEFSASFYNIKSINVDNGTSVTLNNNQLNNLNINRATQSFGTIQPSHKSIVFNKTNSNIVEFVSNLPDKISYEGKVLVNPLGNISGYNDFAYYNTGIQLFADIDIPLRYRANYFLLQTENEVDFSNVEQLNNVKYGSFTIIATNGFPFDVELQAYLFDEQTNKIDSLFVPGANVIPRGVINSSYEVVSSSQSNISVPLDSEKIDHLKKCKQIKLISKLHMPSSTAEIKLFESYNIKINIVADVNYNVGLNN